MNDLGCEVKSLMYRHISMSSLLFVTLCSAVNAQETPFQPSMAKLEEQKYRMTGERLLAQCTIALDPPDKLQVEEIAAAIGTCNGYIAGAEDGKFMQWMMAERCGGSCSPFVEKGFFCKTPEDITDDVRLVVKWLRTHPEDMDTPAATVVQFALREAYPCGAKSSANASIPASPQTSQESIPNLGLKTDSTHPSPSVVVILERVRGEIVQMNYVEAYAWTSLAVTGEITPTEKANLEVSLDSFASHLSKSKLKKAKERAAQLKAQYPQPPPRK